MPTPAECQPIADDISTLTAQEQAQTSAILSLTGIDKWKAMEALGTLRQQIADKKDLLAKGIKEHATDFSADVVIFDLTGTSGSNRIGRIWQLTSAGQAIKQTSSLQGNSIKFSGILAPGGQPLGITIEETDHPTVNGPDFRSAPLKAVEDADRIASGERIEIVILDPIFITAASLVQSAPPLPIRLSLSAGAVGAVDISVNDLRGLSYQR